MTHCRLPDGVHPYFEVHAVNHHEAEKLLARLSALSPADQTRALSAREQMCQALWDALSDLTPESCAQFLRVQVSVWEACTRLPRGGDNHFVAGPLYRLS